jgi:hypothetical protein
VLTDRKMSAFILSGLNALRHKMTPSLGFAALGSIADGHAIKTSG